MQNVRVNNPLFDKNEHRYRQFVEDIGHKYVVQENEIKKSMGEDDLWLPW